MIELHYVDVCISFMTILSLLEFEKSNNKTQVHDPTPILSRNLFFLSSVLIFALLIMRFLGQYSFNWKEVLKF